MAEGEKALQPSYLRPEVIGPEDCPIMHRWTLVNLGFAKLMLHHFLPNADDRDVHDHPRGFITLVLCGGYDDLIPDPLALDRLKLGDRMRPGSLRRRPAHHAHRTKASPRGAWTLVVMGPLRRDWGFWREGRWWPWKKYEEHFGPGMRCERDE